MPSMVTTNSKMTRTASGSLGKIMAATSAMRARSHVIITSRRGRRSARPDRKTPPRNVGTTLAAKVSAASKAERVRSYTSSVSATLAS